MPTTSAKQEKFMEAVAHNKEFAQKVNVPQSVGREFVDGDPTTPLLITDSGVVITDQISPNISTTNDGYLLCENAVIARLGIQEYSPQESSAAGVEPGADGIVRMVRAKEEVFKPESINSFNSVPITDGHPPVMVDATNWTQYAKGEVFNVRQEGSLIRADLLIKDSNTIKKITERGLHKLSCGYYSMLEDLGQGLVQQINIIGNHLAFVTNPRAGDICSIIDSKTIKPKGVKMAKENVKRSLLRFIGIVDEAADKVASDIVDDEDIEVMDDASHEENEISETETIKNLLADISKRLDKLETADKAKVSDSDIDIDEPDADVFAVGDSNSTLISKIEILTPGYRPHKGDKNPKLSVLKQVAVTDSKFLNPLLGSKKLETLSKESIDLLFNIAAQSKASLNNKRTSVKVTDSKPVVKPDPFAAHLEIYNRSKGV